MAKRKVASVQSSSLFDFFSSTSSPAKKIRLTPALMTTRRRSAPGASRETALVIDDSDDEFDHISYAKQSPEPEKRPLPNNLRIKSEVKEIEVLNTVDFIMRQTQPPDDEWAMDDDEAAQTETGELEGVDEDSAMGTEGTLDDLSSCPVCFLVFDGDELDPSQHISTCLDRTSRINAPSGSKPSTPNANTNAFSVLMSSHKENQAWKEAEIDAARAGTNASTLRSKKQHANGRRAAPFFKVMQGMPIAVDAFRYGKIPGVKAYLLTHAHSDHYTNLSSKWENGPIYCSETTANLIKHMLQVDPKWVHPLPLDVPVMLPGTEVTVTLIEANHCPGSVLYLFEGIQTVNAGDSTFKSSFVGSSRIFRYLHCGDYRASPQHVLHPAVKGKKLDLIYLDTTYLNPKYCFPPQKQVIDACAALARRLVLGERPKDSLNGESVKAEPLDGWLQPLVKSEQDDVKPLGSEQTVGMKSKGRTLVVVGTYSIGKERIVKAIARALSSKIYADPRKSAILRCQDDPDLHALLTSDPLEACVHVVPLQHVNSDKIGDYLDRFKGAYNRVIGFRPTGWTFTSPAGADTIAAIPSLITRMQSRTFVSSSMQPMRNSTSKMTLFGVPYSEHSSFFELTCFALSVEWTKIIATVNVGSQSGRAKMGQWFQRWEAERRRRVERGDANVVPFRSIEYW